MTVAGTTIDPRFRAQQVSKEEWLRATAANAAADCLAGFAPVVEPFLASRREPELQALAQLLREGSRQELGDYAEARRGESLTFLVMMLSGGCNANCEICFTDRRRKRGELDPDTRFKVMREARELGCRFVYVPGEGEPTIDQGFWSFLAACRELEMDAIVFTNGIVLSDAASCRKFWGLDPDQAVRRLVEYPVSFYHKLWSLDPARMAEMMCIPAELLCFTPYHGVPLPAGLIRLLEAFPLERVGIEVVIERRNAEEVVDAIVPFAAARGLARIVEMIQHNGRVFGDGGFDPTPAQALRATSCLSPTSCTMATCKAVVTSRGFLSPRIAVLEHQLPVPPADVRARDLFTLLHTTDYVVQRRYAIHTCLCESLPLEMAGCRTGRLVTLPACNVVPAALLTEAGAEL
jgi:hypothetical protein